METIEHLNFVRTNYNMYLTRMKERERINKMIKEIKEGEDNEKDTDTIQKKF